jgi:UDP-glucose 4-epimerase
MIDKPIKKEKWLVTGGAGFIGSHLIETLIDKGDDVYCIDDLSTGNLDSLPKSKLIEVKTIKIQDFDSNLLKINISGIYHLAAQVSVPLSLKNMFYSSSNNLMGTLKVFELAKHYNIPVVYASSSAIYGNLSLGNDERSNFDILSPYARDKLTMEDYAKLCWKIYKVPSLGLRFFNVYGPRQDPTNSYSGVISIFIERLMKKKPVILNGGYQTRDFIYVEDIAQTLTSSMDHILKYPINDNINVGTGNSITINQLLSNISKILDVKPEIILKKLPEGDPKKSIGAYNKLNDILGIKNSNFEGIKSGLTKTISYIKKNETNTSII